MKRLECYLLWHIYIFAIKQGIREGRGSTYWLIYRSLKCWMCVMPPLPPLVLAVHRWVCSLAALSEHGWAGMEQQPQRGPRPIWQHKIQYQGSFLAWFMPESANRTANSSCRTNQKDKYMFDLCTEPHIRCVWTKTEIVKNHLVLYETSQWTQHPTQHRKSTNKDVKHNKCGHIDKCSYVKG